MLSGRQINKSRGTHEIDLVISHKVVDRPLGKDRVYDRRCSTTHKRVPKNLSPEAF